MVVIFFPPVLIGTVLWDLVALDVLAIGALYLRRFLKGRRKGKRKTPSTEAAKPDVAAVPGGSGKSGGGTESAPKKTVSSDPRVSRRLAIIQTIMEADREIVGKILAENTGVSPDDQSETALLSIAKAISDEDLQIYRIAALQDDIDLDLRRVIDRVEAPYPTNDVEPEFVTDLGHLADIYPEQFTLESREFYRRAVMGELQRPVFYENRTGVKLLYILRDVSPSMEFRMMDGSERHIWSRGITINLLRKAMRGEAKYFCRNFAGEPGPLQKIVDPNDAEPMVRQLFKEEHFRSSTNIGEAIRTAVADIRAEGGDLLCSELLLITDGIGGVNTEEELRLLLGDDIHLHVMSIGSPDERDEGGEESPTLKAVATSYQKFA